MRRYGAAFEALRDDPPAGHVFLATMGTVAAHTARATFATNLLAAGGIAVDVAGADRDADDLVAAYDGQPVVCLAGTDAPTTSGATRPAARAARRPARTWVVVAGQAARRRADDSCALGRRRARLPDPHQGEAGMSVPKSFAGLPLGAAGAAPARQARAGQRSADRSRG